MTRECHVRFCERLRGKFPRPTYHFGMKCHIGVDAESGLVHTVRGTAGSVNDVVEANSLLHGKETDAWGDAGYHGAHRRSDANPNVTWHVAMKPGKRRALDKTLLQGSITEHIEKIKASIRARSSIRFA